MTSNKIFTGYYDINQNPIYVGDIVHEGCNGIVAEVIKNPNCKGGYGLKGCGESYCIADANIEWRIIEGGKGLTIEQAKEIFNIFLKDLEMDEEGNFILELRLNPDGTWSHFSPENIKAFKMAFKSLEAWDKVIEELDGKIDEQYDDKYDFCYQQGIEFALELIKKYKKEIEE